MNIYLGNMYPLQDVTVIKDYPTTGTVYIRFVQKDGNFVAFRVNEDDFLKIVQPEFQKNVQAEPGTGTTA
jgi:hypothetical protein